MNVVNFYKIFLFFYFHAMNTFVSDKNEQEEEKPGWTMTFSPDAPPKQKIETLTEGEKGRVVMIMSGRCPECGKPIVGGLCRCK